MPDKPAAERTEPPTPERLRKAREEGRVPQTSEVPSALMIVMLLVVLALMASTLYGWFVGQVRQGFSFEYDGAMDVTSFSELLKAKAAGALATILPFLLAAAAVSVFASLVGSGWCFAPKAVQLKLERISPVRGLKNLFSARSGVRLLVAMAKLTLILTVVYAYLRGKLDVCLSLRHASPEGVLVGIAQLVFGVVARIAIGLIAIAVLDLLFQKWRHKRELRMTRREVLDERRQHEIAPHLRSRIRAVQIEMARKRMLQEVPKADVVVTNPMHVAVALRYEPEEMEAPQVVAKGADLLSDKIKEIARTHAVPIVQRPELARTLYNTVDVGEIVPETLFVAIAELLALIYRLRSKRRAMTGTPNK